MALAIPISDYNGVRHLKYLFLLRHCKQWIS